MDPASQSLLVRRYQPSDQPSVWALHKLALRDTGVDAGDDLYADLSDIDNAYLRSGGEFLVGFRAAELVAMGGFVRLSSKRVELKRMRVHPEYQRRGFGQALLAALEAHARESGCRTLFLETTLVQKAARRLYTKNGYREIERGWTLGFEVIRYEKEVEGTAPAHRLGGSGRCRLGWLCVP